MAGLSLTTGLGLTQQYGGFNPLSLFTGGLVGAVSDATDMSQLGSTTAGVGGITGTGQNLAFLRNQAMANHFVQGTVGSQPTFASYTAGGQVRYGALFDGLDDFMASQSAFALSGSSKMTMVVGLRKSSGELGAGIIAGLGNVTTTNGTAELRAPSVLGGANYGGIYRGSAGLLRSVSTPADYPTDVFNVVTLECDFTAPYMKLYVDGVLISTNTASSGGTFANSVLTLGARAGGANFFKGILRRLFVIDTILSETDRASVRAWAGEGA